jgi:hypothetical protein
MNPHRTHLTHATIHLNTLSTEHPLHTALATALATYTANSNLTATFVRLLPEILKTSASDFGFLAEVVYATPTNDPRSGGVPAGHMKLSCFLGIPFIVAGQLLGACAMANKPGGYTDADIEYCAPLAQIGGLLIAADRS